MDSTVKVAVISALGAVLVSVFGFAGIWLGGRATRRAAAAEVARADEATKRQHAERDAADQAARADRLDRANQQLIDNLTRDLERRTAEIERLRARLDEGEDDHS